ncbi:hypothetical protein O181_035042 [Austropuccinia psidii MF-1]|uniref:BED-type domain-containing protein n=1 Tax=Austropuccinia psidii MF-1 TaxID=1389203 RepID=A0A9Q3H8M7_9BASI|nr:hypothetical protein [Austropuccinia psidii MF-1]
MSSAPSLLCSTPMPSDTKLRSLPSTIDLTQTPKRSWVWVYFSEVNEKYVQCQFVNRLGKACNKPLKKDQTGSTKGMSQHLHVLHCVANPKTISSPLAKNNSMDQFVNILNIKKALSPASLNTALVYFICDADLPLSITKSPAFRALLELLNPAVTNILVHRASLTAHLTNIYFCHQEPIHNYLSTSNINVSFATDAWTIPNIIAYLAVTGHYIDSDFKLTSFLLGLFQIEGNHSVGFMAHTIHLAARDGLKALGSDTGDTSTAVDHDDLNPMAISSLTNPPNGLNLKYNSIIGNISKLASYLCHRLQKREKFITTVNLVYDTDKPTNAKTLLLQVPTQWNSTYEMLNRALDLKDA